LTLASRAYTRDYRDWIAKGNFASVYEWGRERLECAISSQRPDIAAPALRIVADCYYIRGAVALLDKKPEGWHDVQCGYMASVYALRFAIPLLAGLEAQLKDSANYITPIVMTLGLARIFAVDFDEQLLRGWLDERYDVDELTGNVRSGRHILDGIYHRELEVDAETLRRDRSECCQKRDAWPKRPTEFAPFGVLDVEMAINFPALAEFPYLELPYSPTEDDLVIQGMITYHQWND
jgi:hypothetical protein